MNNEIISAVLVLGTIGLLSAIILYFVAKKFKVLEDPKVELILEMLPHNNCGICGFASCRTFAEEIVKSNDVLKFLCPTAGEKKISEIKILLGTTHNELKPMIAVVRCSGSKNNISHKSIYNSVSNCSFAHSLFSGESGCPHGCFGLGDCVESCIFEAIYIDKETGLPVIIEDKCTSCEACVNSCPRGIIEMRYKGQENKRIFVSCISKEKGRISSEHCVVSCIGCMKCEKVCKFDAIKLENHLAYIDFEKCTLCRECVAVCPTNAILEVNFEIKKIIGTQIRHAEHGKL
ncbi:MAG: RnfABCDGE type electron transport complex subunit B [Bacteroidetes bacterium]|nr:RnfABCDGE type electron transport complex subunit B [Bacteroidota bacterium]